MNADLKATLGSHGLMSRSLGYTVEVYEALETRLAGDDLANPGQLLGALLIAVGDLDRLARSVMSLPKEQRRAVFGSLNLPEFARFAQR